MSSSYGEYQLVLPDVGVRFASIAMIQMRAVFGGQDIIGGGTASASGGIQSGIADDAIDGDLSTFIQYELNRGTGYWTYLFPAPVTVREYTITAAADSVDDQLTDWTLQGRNGGASGAWVDIDTRSGEAMPAGITRTFSLYEILVTGGFSGGEPPVNISLEDSATQEVIGSYAPDPSGTTSILLPSAGPYDVAIERAGHRTLVSADHLASEA